MNLQTNHVAYTALVRIHERSALLNLTEPTNRDQNGHQYKAKPPIITH
jgi:hypothetical protein